jgi:signal transduction histidine kinase
MPDINQEVVKDFLKIILIFTLLAYFLFQTRKFIVKEKGLFFLMGGFAIMLMGGIVDFCGDLPALNSVFILGQNFPYHERIEDILGIIGFIMFTAGIAIQIRYVTNEYIEKEKTIQKLNKQSEELKRFDELKSKFVMDVSHEFRSPLTSVNMCLNNIIDGLMGSVTSQQKEALIIGKKNIGRLSRLVSDILTLSQIESGKLALNRELSDISSIAEEAYLSLRPMFENKRITFNKVIQTVDDRVWCDTDKIMQVFVNLLTNSLKYSSENSSITVKISDEDHGIKVEIEDCGKGISPEDMEKLFSRFEKLDPKNEDSIGLGLVISKEIINLHHGRIWAESKLREGTHFIFTIPKDLRMANQE